MFREKKYIIRGCIQFNEKDEPCICGSRIKYLDAIKVNAYRWECAQEIGLKILNEKYPEYNNMVSSISCLYNV